MRPALIAAFLALSVALPAATVLQLMVLAALGWTLTRISAPATTGR